MHNVARASVIYAELPHAQHAFEVYDSPRAHQTAEAIGELLSWVHAKSRH